MKRWLLVLLLPCFAAFAEPIQLEHEDLKLNAKLVKAQDSWTEGPVVLMTHGTLAHGEMEIMSGLQSMLKESGVSSLSITLSLGQDNRKGMYDCASKHDYAHSDAITEIGLWANWLKGQGVGRFALLGHSRGGNQTAWYASEKPDDAVSTVFLIAPATWTEEKAPKSYAKRYGTELAPLLEKATAMVESGKGGEFLSDVGFIYCEKATVSARAFVAEYRPDSRRHSPVLLLTIQAPVVVFAGSEDTVVEGLAEEVEMIADGERLRLEMIDGADHFFRDLYSQDIVDIIADSL